MLAAFLDRVNPLSTKAKPACIENTKMDAMTIHSVSITTLKSIVIFIPSSIFKKLFSLTKWGELRLFFDVRRKSKRRPLLRTPLSTFYLLSKTSLSIPHCITILWKKFTIFFEKLFFSIYFPLR